MFVCILNCSNVCFLSFYPPFFLLLLPTTPFTILQVSTINPKVYHTATFLGLLPAQLINVYLGSTLRSMHEVLNNHGTAITGYISFGVEVSSFIHTLSTCRINRAEWRESVSSSCMHVMITFK